MKILVLNRGSSSLKCCLYEFTNLPKQCTAPIWEAHLDGKETVPILKIKKGGTEEIYNGHGSLQQIVESLIRGKTAILSSLSEVDAIGHRIVHGGKEYKKSVLIDPSVKQKIRLLADLAPLHNLLDLEGIEILEGLFPQKPQIAVFDTAFHHTLPLEAVVYPGPHRWVEEGIQRYGFHGTSFQYCTRRTTELLGSLSPKLLICHLGSGASLCAIKEGKSIDTTMGFTPLEGLMMDTRSGTIDPGILLYLLEKKKKTPAELSKELYEHSGLLGLSGISSDMRDILASKAPQAKLALEVYLHRLSTAIGSMAVSLGGLDTIVFTAGIGENAPLVRKRTCDSLSFLDVKLDEKKNESPSKQDRDLTSPASKVKILLIHTQEAFEIARECWLLVGGHRPGLQEA